MNPLLRLQEMNDKYELKVLKSVALKLIDKLIDDNKNNLGSLKSRREEIVFDIAREIYTQSGRKIPFSEIRDLLDSRIETRKAPVPRKEWTEEPPQNSSIRDSQIEIGEAQKAEIKKNAGKFGGDEEKTQIFLRVRKVISEQLGVEEGEVNLDCDLYSHLGADDWDVLELIVTLEEEFGLEISDEVADSRLGINTIGASFSGWGSGSSWRSGCSPTSSSVAGADCIVRNFVDLIYEKTC